uniref:Heat shock transcription factor n=1 Tax=Lilium longiflorum TaxID=4690 RepID=G9J1I4_LILLO|nr:heat shock transcription factor [Lilium longiflorum]
MEGSNSHSCSTHQIQVVAPFIAKTYQMVNDPSTDVLIRWGSTNNSFIVLDYSRFSHVLLPSYFKHSNFSSFIRQLNTYGFRKMDSDRWEFAHESFLRGQAHLLPLIIRHMSKKEGIDKEEDMKLLQEVGRLRREQQVFEVKLQEMSKRLRDTERKPQQIMSFLFRLAKDPDFLPRIISSKQQQLTVYKKRRLLVLPHQTWQNQYPTNSLRDDGAAVGPATPFDQSRRKPVVSSELNISEQSPPVMAPGFPFSILGEGFF